MDTKPEDTTNVIAVSSKNTSPKKCNKIVKYIVMGVFILLPFVGFYMGMEYQTSQDSMKHSRTIETNINPSSTPKKATFDKSDNDDPQLKSKNIHVDNQYEVYTSHLDRPYIYHPYGENSGPLYIDEDLIVSNLETGEEKVFAVYERLVPQEMLEFLENVPPEVSHRLSLELLDWSPNSEHEIWGKLLIFSGGDPPIASKIGLFKIDLSNSTVSTYTLPNPNNLFGEVEENLAEEKVLYESIGDDLSLYVYNLTNEENRLLVTYRKDIFDQYCRGFIDYYSIEGNCHDERSLQATWERENISYYDFVTREEVKVKIY